MEKPIKNSSECIDNGECQILVVRAKAERELAIIGLIILK